MIPSFVRLCLCTLLILFYPIYADQTDYSKICVITLAKENQETLPLEGFVQKPLGVTRVIIRADVTLDEQLLAQELGLIAPVTVTADLLKKAVFYLGAHHTFKTVTFSYQKDAQETVLHITLESHWILDDLKISGVLYGKDFYARLYAIKTGHVFDQSKHAHSVQIITNFLKDSGYVLSRVQDTLEYCADKKTVNVTLAIEPGNKFTIASVTLDLKNAEPHELQQMNTFLAERLVGKSYSTAIVEDALHTLKKYLVERGFYLMEHATQKNINTEQALGLTITAQLSACRKFIFQGNNFFTKEQLLDQILLFGKAAWLLPVEILASDIAEKYKQNGFLDVHVQTEFDGPRCMFSITEGKQKEILHSPREKDLIARDKLAQSAFGKTIVRNSSMVPADVITRELTYQENGDYSLTAVQESTAALRALDVFDEIELYPIATPWDHNQKTMLLKVHADDTYELRVRAGLSLQQMSPEFTFKNVSYVAGGTFLIKNPFNKADQIRFEADYTHGEHTFYAQYSLPWIFGVPIRSSFQVYATNYLQPGWRNNQKNLYHFVQQGFEFGFNYKKRPFEAQLNAGIAWMETKVVNPKDHRWVADDITHALNFQPLLVGHKIPYVLFEPTLFWVTTDNKLNPTQGSMTLCSLKGMFPLRLLSLNSYFLKILLEHSIFIPVGSAVLALRGRCGHIFYERFENVMPAERFYLGGANSIRSYQTDMCPPLGVFTKSLPEDSKSARPELVEGNERSNGSTGLTTSGCSKQIFVPQGSRSLLNLNLELRMPAYKDIWCTLFQDLGALSNNYFADIRPRNLLAGTGFGIHYNTPIGPLRFEIAWKWQRPDRCMPLYAWFLSFGNAF